GERRGEGGVGALVDDAGQLPGAAALPGRERVHHGFSPSAMKMWNDLGARRNRFMLSRRSRSAMTSVVRPGATLTTKRDSDWKTRYRPRPAPAVPSSGAGSTRQRFR